MEISFEFLDYYKEKIRRYENQTNILGASLFQIHQANFARNKMIEEEDLREFEDGR